MSFANLAVAVIGALAPLAVDATSKDREELFRDAEREAQKLHDEFVTALSDGDIDRAAQLVRQHPTPEGISMARAIRRMGVARDDTIKIPLVDLADLYARVLTGRVERRKREAMITTKP